MHVMIVSFNLVDMTEAGYRDACAAMAPAFAEVPGLLTKVWLADPAVNTYGGIYFWTDREAMEGYLESELFQTVIGFPHFANITSRDYTVLEELTKVTQSGIAVLAGASA